jgi:hypothetical protein
MLSRLDSRPTVLFRVNGERRALRAPSSHAAAWEFGHRIARREFGRRGSAVSVALTGYSEGGAAAHYSARIGSRVGSAQVLIVVRVA